MLIVPLTQFQIALAAEGRLNILLLFLNKSCKAANSIFYLLTTLSTRVTLQCLCVDSTVEKGLINCKVNLGKLISKCLILLCPHQFFFEVVEDSLSKLIITRVLCQLGKLKIEVNIV